MKAILRNFLSVVRRYKLATLLNILGLSVAFAAFMVIMIQLDYDHGFDKFHKDYDKIFRMEFTRDNSIQAVICRPLAERFFESSPHILAGTITYPGIWMGNMPFHVENDGARIFYQEMSLGVSPEFTDVFTFDMVEGSQDALKTPDHVIIPLSLARKLFGNESAIGKRLILSQANLIIGAVFYDFPSNSIVNNCIYTSIPEEENKQHWGNWNYHAYFRVNDPSNLSQLWDNFKRDFDAKAMMGQDFDWDESGFDMRFTPLPDIHYVTDVTFDSTPKASKTTLMVLFAIAIVLVVIASINFTNFSTALTPTRIKSINTQSVLGAQRNTIRLSLVSEAVIVGLLSYVVALGLIVLFQQTPLTKMVDADLSLTAHPLIVGGTILIALFAGLLAGLYPAFYMTSFAPALVIKGSFGLSPKGRKLRNTLIGIQFIASFALMIGAFFIYLQNDFMQHSPLGYDKDELITTNIGRIHKQQEAFTNQLKSFSGIEDVTFSMHLLSSSDQYMGWGVTYNGEQINFQCLPVDYTFLKTMGIEISEGRDFRREDDNMQYGAYVFNETAQKKYNLELNTTIGFEGGGEIVGFMPDVKFASFRTAVDPMAFHVMGTERWSPLSNAYIRVKAGTDVRAAISHIRSTLAEFDSEYPFVVRFYDEVLQQLYEKENSLSSLISLFSLLAIFISIVGVFGLVVFDSECRRKEVGVRKAHGASTPSIILLFNKAYFIILLICFAIAAPLAWYTVSRWLENFAYKTPMYWWVYLFAFMAVAIITASTVTFQNWRVANENPVNSIKGE
ncbi:MAG: FtsX-like permease family protein [Bacteroidales bacterium]|nr:FtsX-like permease family protein [Bacteroidales bacterium]